MIDYNADLERLQGALGQRYLESPFILNTPGASIALKVDPFHYLAITPMFLSNLGKWAGFTPGRVQTVLIKTGNLLTDPSRARHSLRLAVIAGNAAAPLQLWASFVLASFIDRAVVLSGGEILPVSGLRLAGSERQAVSALFSGRSPLQEMAFADYSG